MKQHPFSTHRAIIILFPWNNLEYTLTEELNRLLNSHSRATWYVWNVLYDSMISEEKD